MQHLQKKLPFNCQNSTTATIFTDDSLFFDIETTGFSPNTSSLYLIGCMRKRDNELIIDQFFAENKSEEPKLLTSFLALLDEHTTLLSFNGEGFDLPYIKAKYSIYSIEETLDSLHSIDIYKCVGALKYLLKLPNYKQKTIENFLGIQREDLYSGGELIAVYEDYIRTHSEEGSKLLLLHNFEDVTGMLELLPILSYYYTFTGSYHIQHAELTPFITYDGEEKKELVLTLLNTHSVPNRVSCQYKNFYVTMHKEITKIRIELFEGELKYFYENYKDYFYLPAEDTAMHKSVAEFVDKAYRERAKASNCYTRKTGQFLPQYSTVMQPVFKQTYKDKFTYFELTEEFLTSEEKLCSYIAHIFQNMPRK